MMETIDFVKLGIEKFLIDKGVKCFGQHSEHSFLYKLPIDEGFIEIYECEPKYSIKEELYYVVKRGDWSVMFSPEALVIAFDSIVQEMKKYKQKATS
jgi:hypothetical protein